VYFRPPSLYVKLLWTKLNWILLPP